MSDGGKRWFTAPLPETRRGWRDDPERPGIQRYWSGAGWDESISPRSKPEPAWRQARMVAIGVLIAAAIIFLIWRMQQPSDVDCLNQATDVITGDRVAVEPTCRDR